MRTNIEYVGGEARCSEVAFPVRQCRLVNNWSQERYTFYTPLSLIVILIGRDLGQGRGAPVPNKGHVAVSPQRRMTLASFALALLLGLSLAISATGKREKPRLTQLCGHGAIPAQTIPVTISS